MYAVNNSSAGAHWTPSLANVKRQPLMLKLCLTVPEMVAKSLVPKITYHTQNSTSIKVQSISPPPSIKIDQCIINCCLYSMHGEILHCHTNNSYYRGIV